MQLGWIDFSKSERSKILSVLDLLQESGTLDELGIAPVRDGFSNIFFPGTSTIQTRAKYFFIIPYILKDLERSNISNPSALRRSLDDKERKCGERLLKQTPNEIGIIGGRSLTQGHWVKRAPVEIYWNGLRQYRIFTFPHLTLAEYLRISTGMKKRKADLKMLGNRNDDAEENECDDKDAGSSGTVHFWNIPTYRENWMDNLTMDLTRAEAAFLKEQIIASHPDSMLGYILRSNMREILECDRFDSLSSLIERFPEHIRQDYHLAHQFSHFLYIIRVVYNMITSRQENQTANIEYEALHPSFSEAADVDLDKIILRLGLSLNVPLCKFLHSAKSHILADDFDSLCKCIKDREILLKGTGRAKTAHPGEFDPNAWFGGFFLDYRFSNALRIIRDIFESVVSAHAESESEPS